MKSYRIAGLIGAMSLTSIVASVESQAAGVVHKLVFDRPLVIQQSSLPLKAEKVDLWLDRNTNRFKEGNIYSNVYTCSTKIQIEGRDIAVRSQEIGEHYFGSMELNCSTGSRWSRWGFKTRFSRVLFLGIRNCVESETMIDQDYCTLVALAMRKEGDLSFEQGDLVFNTAERKTFYRVNSSLASSAASRHGLLPEGLNPAMVDSVQIFPLSIDRSGKQFFLNNTGDLSNFPAGANQYLELDPASAGRDQELKRGIEGRLNAMDAQIREISASARPKETLDARMGAILGQYSDAARSLLSIVSPVEYYHLEKRLKAVESDLILLTQTYNPVVKDRASFVAQYASQFSEYGRLSEYFSDTKRTSKIAQLLGLESTSRSGNRGTAPVSVPRGSSPLEDGKEFRKTDKFLTYGDAFLWDSDGACGKALNACNEYLSGYPEEIRLNYSCGSSQSWRTSLERYCIVRVVRARNR